MKGFKVLILLMVFLSPYKGYCAYLENYSLSQGETDYNGEQWRGTHYWPDRITIVRNQSEIAGGFSIDLPGGYYVKGWRNSANNRSERYEVEIKGDGNMSFSVRSVSRDGDTEVLSVDDYGVGTPSQVYMQLQSTGRTENSGGAIGIRGIRTLSVRGGIPDGIYYYNSQLNFTGRTDIRSVEVELVTLPEISVGDIDFGVHAAGSILDLSETSEINIGGGPGRSYTLEVEEEVVELVNPSTWERIPVNLSIEGSPANLSSAGIAVARLRAVIEGVRAPERGGTYRGTATVILNYD